MWDPLVWTWRRDLHTRMREVNFTSHLRLSFETEQLPCRQLSPKTGTFIAHFNLPDLLPQRNRLPTTPPEPRALTTRVTLWIPKRTLNPLLMRQRLCHQEYFLINITSRNIISLLLKQIAADDLINRWTKRNHVRVCLLFTDFINGKSKMFNRFLKWGKKTKTNRRIISL